MKATVVIEIDANDVAVEHIEYWANGTVRQLNKSPGASAKVVSITVK